MTFVYRPAPSSLSEVPKLSRTSRINALVRDSVMQVSASFDTRGTKWAIIGINGPAAKLPSTTNNKMLSVPRSGVLKTIERMIENTAERSYQNLLALKNAVRNLRAIMTRNPDHIDQLTALTALWNSATAKRQVKFPLDKDNRGAVFVLLSPLMNRMDTHNIPKAVCDWLQEIGVIENDRYVDAAARRAADFGMAGQESFIIIIRYDSMPPREQTFETALQLARKVYGDKYFCAISQQGDLPLQEKT